MADTTPDGIEKRNIPLSILFYILWIATVAMSILILFLTRGVVLASIALLVENHWLHRILDKVAFVLAGILVLIFIGYSEYFLRLMGLEVIVVFIAHLFFEILGGFAGIGFAGFILIAAEFVVGTSFFGYSVLPEKFNRLPI